MIVYASTELILNYRVRLYTASARKIEQWNNYAFDQVLDDARATIDRGVADRIEVFDERGVCLLDYPPELRSDRLRRLRRDAGGRGS